KSGLYALPGASATARQAACAKRLELPTTKVVKVKFGFRRDSLAPSSLSASGANESEYGSGSSGGGAAAGSTVTVTSQSWPRTPERVSRMSGTYRSVNQSRARRVGTPTVNIRPSNSTSTALASQVSYPGRDSC